MKETYKIITNKYDSQVTPIMPISKNVNTRGNTFKLSTERCKYDLRKYSFSSRVVHLWNSLPDGVVDAESVNSFKNALDKYWANVEVFYNYKAEINNL